MAAAPPPSRNAARHAERSPVAVVGKGRMGTAVTAALRQAGIRVAGPFGRGESPSGAKVVLLCVPDGAVADAARPIELAAVVGHCSGILPLAVLERPDAFSIHPLLSVTRETASFRGGACAVRWTSPQAEAACLDLVHVLGMVPLSVPDERRAIYHAAASTASNFVVTLAVLAERLMATVGVSREHLAPLVSSSVENWRRQGAAGLTGPVVRGDESTIAKQRAAIAAEAEDLLPLWDELIVATRRVAAPHDGAATSTDKPT